MAIRIRVNITLDFGKSSELRYSSMITKREIDLSPTDRVALHQSRELDRRKRVLRRAWLLLMATVFALSSKRYKELVDEVRKIINQEVKRIYEMDHPTTKRAPKGRKCRKP